MNQYKLIFSFLLLLFSQSLGFKIPIQNSKRWIRSGTTTLLNMKWTFSGEAGSMKDLGAIGSEGEYYFHPQKQAKLSGFDNIGKQRIIALFPYNNVIVPGSLEKLNVFEMKYRQLLSDTGESSFGISFYSQAMQRVGLVGTLVKVKSQKLFEDGRVLALVQGTERYYIEEVISERPYIKARVRVFKDYNEYPKLLQQKEQEVFDDVRCNFKYLEILYPTSNYTLSSNILSHQPPEASIVGARSVKLFDESLEIARSSKFSFAVLDSLRCEPQVKLAMMQEYVTERRLGKLKTLCERSTQYLREELKKTGRYSQSEIDRVREDVLRQDPHSLMLPKESLSKVPENFVNGQWLQQPTFFD